jgi:hypothetical protein
VVACEETALDALSELARSRGVPIARIGTTGGERLRIEPGIDVSLEDARNGWRHALAEVLDS